VDTYGDTPRKLRQEIAHAAAFNQGRVSEYGFAFSCYQDFRRLLDIKSASAQWLKNNWEHYQNLDGIADIAVWRERQAMALSAPLTFATAMQVEQLLIEDRIPFTVSQSDWPADARAVVLPNLVGLDDRRCAKIAEFVQKGAALWWWAPRRPVTAGCASGRISGCGKFCRPEFGFGSCVTSSISRAPVCPLRRARRSSRTPALSNIIRRGRGAWFTYRRWSDPASLAPLFTPNGTFNLGLDLTNWTVPKEVEGLRRAVAWLIGNRPTLRVGGGAWGAGQLLPAE